MSPPTKRQKLSYDLNNFSSQTIPLLDPCSEADVDKSQTAIPNSRNGIEAYDDYAPQIIAREIDLEVAIRKRLAGTIEARIRWGMILQDYLLNKTVDEGGGSDEATSTFKKIAIDALIAVEEPSAVLLKAGSSHSFMPATTSVAHPMPIYRNPYQRNTHRNATNRHTVPNIKSHSRSVAFLYTRPTPQTLATLACPTCGRTSFTALQGLLNHARLAHGVSYAGHDECVQACAVKLGGEKGFGGECDSKDLDPEEALKRAGGVEVRLGDSAPGLRRIFERAVGVAGVGTDTGGEPLFSGKVEEDMVAGASNSGPTGEDLFLNAGKLQEKPSAIPNTLSDFTPPSTTSISRGHIHIDTDTHTPTSISTGVHLTKTLGHHADTPALALFLGRKAARRRINVYDEKVDIGDHVIDNAEHDVIGGVEKRRPWRMPYASRSAVRASLEELQDEGLPSDVAISPSPSSTALASSTSIVQASNSSSHIAPSTKVPNEIVLPTPSVSTTTRFHIAARISICDRSLWIPPNLRSSTHTHKWMVSVDAPSYSLPITTILHKFSVTFPSSISKTAAYSTTTTDLNNIENQAGYQTMSTTDPPFVIIGTAVEPFLARVRLQWAGGGAGNADTDVEHWVDLDPMQGAYAVLGAEQVLDIELDRNTVFMPPRTGYVRAVLSHNSPPPPEALDEQSQEQQVGASFEAGKPENVEEESQFEYARGLRLLLPRVPMTLRDARRRRDTVICSRIMAQTTAQHLTLTPGRRKAIEWARARALRDLYDLAITSQGPEEIPESGSAGDVRLSTAVVYAWLEHKGHFPRPTITPRVVTKLSESSAAKSIQPSDASLPVDDIQESKAHFCPSCGWDNTLPSHDEGACGAFPTGLPAADAEDMIRRVESENEGDARKRQTEENYQLADTVFFSSSTRRHAKIRALVESVDSKLLFGIRDAVKALHLPTFAHSNALGPLIDMPSQQHIGAEVTYERVAPYAVLTMGVRKVVAMLVKVGLTDHFSRRPAGLPSQPLALRKTDSSGPNGGVLTAACILRGLLEASTGSEEENLRLCVSRIGARVGSQLGTSSAEIVSAVREE